MEVTFCWPNKSERRHQGQTPSQAKDSSRILPNPWRAQVSHEETHYSHITFSQGKTTATVKNSSRSGQLLGPHPIRTSLAELRLKKCRPCG